MLITYSVSIIVNHIKEVYIIFLEIQVASSVRAFGDVMANFAIDLLRDGKKCHLWRIRSYFLDVASWFKMAAAVESTNQRYYCHRCEQNISPTIPVRTYLMSSHLYRSIGHSSYSKIAWILSFSTSFLCQFIYDTTSSGTNLQFKFQFICFWR